MSLEVALAWLGRGPEWLEEQARALSALDLARERAAEALAQREGDLAAHLSGHPPALPEEELGARLEEVEGATAAFDEARSARRLELDRDRAAHARRASLAPELEAAEEQARIWGRLDDLIGSADGSAFREFAQSLTLEAVIEQANHHLQDLARRYRLMRVPGEDLELQVADLEMGDEIRSVNSLSGGESFLVSLALALGLASLSAKETRIDSLFIDEGFGSLDPDSLDVALAALDGLRAEGRQVGVISHVESLAERIGVQVEVRPQRPGYSRVRVSGPGA